MEADSEALNPLFHSPKPETAENILEWELVMACGRRRLLIGGLKVCSNLIYQSHLQPLRNTSLLCYVSTCTASRSRRLPTLEKQKTFLDLLERLIMAQERTTSL